MMQTFCLEDEYSDKINLRIAMNLQFFAESAGDKTEPATPKKLEDARNEGQVAKSEEIVSAVKLLVFFVMLRFLFGFMGERFINSFTYMFNTIGTFANSAHYEISYNVISALMREALITILITVLPVFAVAFAIAFAGEILQVKFHITTKPLIPKFSKLNPVNGFKRLFSLNSLIRLLKSIVLVAISAYLVYSTIISEYSFFMNIYDYSLNNALAKIADLVIGLAIKVCAIYLAVGFLDLVYQKMHFAKEMRMTKQEVKEEFKNAEGDPQVKGKIKQRMRESSMRRMMQSLPEADVVITNPTHFAVAIKYDLNKAQAPYVLAKGEDHLAQRIKETAREHGIEIVENKSLARALYYNVDIGQEIPQELYQAVAEVLAFVFNLKGRN